MSLEFPLVVPNPPILSPRIDTYRMAVQEAYHPPAATTPRGMLIVHADTVTISDEARAAYRRMIEATP
jgi:hypothetical protein